MKTKSIFTVPLICLLLSACYSDNLFYDARNIAKIENQAVGVASITPVENGIQVTGTFFTQLEHEITYLPNPSYDIVVRGIGRDFFQTGLYKVAFLRPGKYTIQAGYEKNTTRAQSSSGRPPRDPQSSTFTVVAEREIDIVGDRMEKFFQYKNNYSPGDYFITSENHGSLYREKNMTLIGAGSGRGDFLMPHPTQFYAVVDPEGVYNQYPGFIRAISEFRWRRYPNNYSGNSLNPFSYNTEIYPTDNAVPYSFIESKFHIFWEPRPGAVPLYSIRKRYYSDQGNYYLLDADFNCLSTENEVDVLTITEKGSGWRLETYPGEILGYVYPIQSLESTGSRPGGFYISRMY